MLKLAKYLKPFILLLLAAVILLFGQAMSDLNLPNFMSKIVNVGIQQSGIEHTAPEAISVNALSFMKIFMNESQIEVIENSYILLEKTEENIAKYPLLEIEDVYVLNSENYEDIDVIFEEAGYTFIITAQNMINRPDAEQTEPEWNVISVLKDVIKRNTSKESDNTRLTEINLSELYAIMPVLEQMPKEDVGTMDQMQKQIGITLTKEFYKEVRIRCW